VVTRDYAPLAATARASLAVVAAVTFSTSIEAAAVDSTGEGALALFSEDQAARGESLYAQHCAACHGAKLEGNPAVPLAGEKFLGRWADGQHSLDDLLYIIRTLMPYNAPGSLSRQQYADLAAYILKSNHYPAGDAELPPRGAALKQMIAPPR
jgi:S-disulfanyl-L-cysteine oxidoreductase SoxD